MMHLLKKDRMRKHSALLVRWITLFSIMVFIALLIMGVYFYRMNSVLENNLKNYNEAKVKQISKEIDAAGVKLSVAAYDITAKIPAEGDELASSVEARKKLIKEVANHIILNRSISTSWRLRKDFTQNSGLTQRVNVRPHTRAPLTCRQFHAKLQLRSESRNAAFRPQKLHRLYYHFGV